MAPPPVIAQAPVMMNQNQMNPGMPMQNTPGMPQSQQMLNQSNISGGTTSVASSAPQFVDLQYAKSYFDEIQQMFVSPDFKTA